jgi:hypothetical protein
MINIKYRDFEDGFFTNVDSQKSKKIIFERSIKCSTFEIIDTNKNYLEEKYNFLSDRMEDSSGYYWMKKGDFSNFEGFIQTRYKMIRDTYYDHGPKKIEVEIEEYIFFYKKNCAAEVAKYYDFFVVYYDKNQSEDLDYDNGNVWGVEPLLLTYRQAGKTFGFNNSNGVISKVQVWDAKKESQD